MNLMYTLVTAITVSLDAFFVGISISLNRCKNLLLPITVALTTYVLCLAACLIGEALRQYLAEYVKYTSAAVLIGLGLDALCKKSRNLPSANIPRYFATGFCVGADGAIAGMTLVMQGVSDIFWTPLLFAATHFVAVFLGGFLSQNITGKANILSAFMFFALAAIKLFG